MQLSKQMEIEAAVRDAVQATLSEFLIPRIVLWFRSLFGKFRIRRRANG